MWFIKCITNIIFEKPKANGTKHLPHEPLKMICRKTQEMAIKILGKCIDRYQFCLQESSWTRGGLKKNRESMWTSDRRAVVRKQRYVNHACHASTFEKWNIHKRQHNVYLGLCWLTFNRLSCPFLDSSKIWAAFKTFWSHIWHLDRHRRISLWTNI